MHRIKLMFGWLLAALWLSATGLCFFDLHSDCSGDGGSASVVAPHTGKTLPLETYCSFGQSARSWSRRPWTQGGTDGFPCSPAASELAISSFSQSDPPSAISDISLGLAKAWQFYWRTALAPRAPSAVS